MAEPRTYRSDFSDPLKDDDIVISGIAGHFPDSDSAREFVDNLYNKVDLVTDDDRRWYTEHPEIPQRTGKVREINKFDSTFFGVHYKQAHSMDPMCRMLLERAYEAVIDAGVHPKQLRGTRTGVFIGTCLSESEKTWFYDRISLHGFGITGCSRAMYANRISYWLGIHGPSYSVDTACSSSIYALDHAYRAIRDDLCDYALVGGANLCLHPYVSLQFSRLGVLSMDGSCKSFDENANGYARSETISVIFLQKAKDAKRVYGQIIHTKTNCDGYKPQGITYPSGEMQKQLLDEFYDECKIAPNKIDYIEAHGTGTQVGDPEEVCMIDTVFCTGRTESLKMGSVKSNCGHSEPASGMCSIAKICLGMNDGYIPPNINYNEPRKCIDALNNGHLQVITEKTKWDGKLIGLNSFGFGGANCHVLLRDVHKKKIDNGTPRDDIPRLVCVSGRTEDAVNVILDDLENRPLDAEYVSLFHNIHREDINGHVYRGYTLLQKEEPRRIVRGNSYSSGDKRPIWFVFSGMGSQWPGMGVELMKIPVFADAIHRCHRVLQSKGIDLIKIITERDPSMFDNILNSFVGIAAIQIGLVDVLTACGVVPDYIIGHSVGELGCAYADKCFTAEQMILAAYSRGLASIETDTIKGLMAAVGLGYTQVRNMCPPEIEVACHNSAVSCTISGPAGLMKTFIAELQSKGIFAREVNCSNIAYHSRYIADAGPRLLKYLKQVIPEPKERSSKWLSSSVPKDEWNTPMAKYSSAEYHTNNLLKSVLFEETARNIHKNAVTIEIAPHGLLQAILRRSMNKDTVNIALTQRGHKDNTHVLFTALGKLYEQGLQLNLSALYPAINFPVSRGTPTISNLIRWEHSDDWHVMKFKKNEKIKSGERTVVIDTREEDLLFLTGHVIDGRNLYPATGYLYLVWETLALMRGKLVTELSVVFENVRFIRATNIPKDGRFEMIVMIQKGSGDFEIIESGASVVKGNIQCVDHPEREFTKLPEIVVPQSDDLLPLKTRDVYKELRLRGYNYSGMFKSILECDNFGNVGLIKWLNNWVAFMDNMLQMQLLQEDTRSLFVPTSIERLVIDCKEHTSSTQENSVVVEDTITSTEMKVYVHHKLGIIKSGGIEIKGLKANVITRRKPLSEPVLEKYQFVPFDSVEKYSTVDAMRICLQLVLENSEGYKIPVIEVDDETNEPLANVVLTVLSDLPLIQANITVLSTRTFELPELIKVEDKKISAMEDCLITIGTGLLKDPKLLQSMIPLVKNKGFMISRENRTDELDVPSDLHLITVAQTDDERFVLLRQKKAPVRLSVVNITSEQFDRPFSWIEPLKDLVKTNSVLVVSERDPLNGILGLVNCIRKEPDCSKVRCVFVMDDDAPPFDIEHDLYKNQIEKDIAFNVYKDGAWGCFRHLLIDSSKTVDTLHAYVNVTTKGDLSSLSWIEGCLQNRKDGNNQFAEVYYAALNFRDVMTATGKISIETIMQDRFTQDCVQGLEYSARDHEGKRIMGMLGGRGLSTRILIEEYLNWDVPDHWSLEDAATVPIAYGTVYYAMFLIGQIRAGQSILIHSGTGGVGQAAINVALFTGCKVFTTVGTEEKRAFIKQHFSLPDNQIGNSRDTSFEQMILRETNGRGVDFVLNSLAEEKLQASLRCLAFGGKFLEIGKFDLSNNSKLGMELFMREVSFHGVMLDRIFLATLEVKQEMYKKIRDGVLNGAVKPLVRTIFAQDEVEQAFRYMAAGKHIGKVLIKIKNEEPEKKIIPSSVLTPAKPRFYCDPDKSYVIIGGLGGFGLELTDWMVLRGARKILLTSRSGLTKGYQAMRIRIWRSYGIEIKISTADIATREGCTAVLHNASLMGPVDGIFNLSVVLRDALFENQTGENFETSFGGKAYGTRHLDDISRKMCPLLRHFVVFSSVSCGRGNAGQTNYGMANSVMERICEKRRNDGLPALAIQWGAVGDVGLVADMQDNDAELEIGGTLQQRITNCLECMDIFMRQTEPVVASMVVAEKKVGLAAGTTAVAAVACILGIKDLKCISMQSNLAELGMDSMMAVEIKQTLEREFEVFLTAHDIRSLTFARLQDIDETKKTETQSTNETVNEHETDGLQLILKFAGEEEWAPEAVVQLGSLTNEKRKLFMIPGIEGMASVFNTVASKLDSKVLVLQLPYTDNSQSIQEMAALLLPTIKENIQNEEFNIVAYSFGTLIAIEIAYLLEAEGYKGKLCFIDGSPNLLKEVAIQKVSFDNEDNYQLTLLCNIAALLSPVNTESLTTILEKSLDWKSRIDVLFDMIPMKIGFSKEYLYRMLGNAYNKIKAVYNYQSVWQNKLKCPLNLIKPNIPTVSNIDEDLRLSEYVEKPVSISYIDGNHATILENDELSNLISSMIFNEQTYTVSDDSHSINM